MKLAVVGAIVLMLGSMAMAQTPYTVTYTIEIGGDNHETQYKNDVNVAFTPGSTTPPIQLGPNLVTWDVMAAASGTDALGYSIQGIANLVFNLELQDEAGTPVAPNEFLSTINDGNFDSIRALNNGVAEPFERAAFCLGFDVDVADDPSQIPYVMPDPYDGIFDNAGPPAGPGRLYDPVSVGGPFMDRVQFPSTSYHGGGRLKGSAYFADCNGNLVEDSTELDGVTDADGNGILDVCEDLAATVGGGLATEVLTDKMLSGMGAGYSQFSASANSVGVGMAVGSVIPTWGVTYTEVVGLGVKPVCEGQIDMMNLPMGTYKLVLTAPADSNNVVPVSYVVLPTAGAGGFAVKADAVNGAEVVFYWDPGVVPVTPTLWQSVRTHGNGVGELAIDLVATDGANPTTEPRNQGIQKLVIVFDGALTGYASGGVAITGAGLAVSGESLATTNVANDTLVLTLTGSVDKTCYKIDVAGVATNVAGDTTCLVGALAGDANNSRTMTTTDMAMIKSRIPQPWTNNNVRTDVNVSGTMTTTDMALAKAKIASGNLQSCPP